MNKLFLVLGLILSVSLPAHFNVAHAIEISDEYNAHTYDRNLFGRWADKDRDCRDLRAEILIDESLSPVTMDPSGCRVVSGEWIDYYTFDIITDASKIDIDHLVPLQEVWVSGGYTWDRETLRYFFNDRTNLVVTHQSVNRSKSNREPHEWNYDIANMCGFVLRWVEVKKMYQLTFDLEEYLFLVRNINQCLQIE